MFTLAIAPFFMFAASHFSSGAEQQAVTSTLARYVQPVDYLSIGIVRAQPQLASRVQSDHVFALPPSVAAVTRAAQAACSSGAKLLVYDGEHWESTPSDEQADLTGAIQRGKHAAIAGGCSYGMAPDGEYLGIAPRTCRYDFDAAVTRGVDWDDIRLFNIQAQRLLSDTCASQGGVNSYVSLVRAIVGDARAKAARTTFVAQMSFRYTPPARMIDAMQRLNGVVDGFYFAYPERTACTYCSPENLARVLQALKRT